MNEPILSRRMLVFILGYSFLFLSIVVSIKLFDSKTTVVFCGVRKGDSTYIRVNNKIDILIDAGGDSLSLTCLGKYMPFYDRTIEIAFITYNRKSQYYGYKFVSKRYRIDRLYTLAKESRSASYQSLLENLQKSGTRVIYAPLDASVVLGDAIIEPLWPAINSDEINTPAKYMAYSLLFTQRARRILFVGRIPEKNLQRLLSRYGTKYTEVKFSEYGFETHMLSPSTGLADSGQLLINHRNFIADTVPTYILENYKSRITKVGSSHDVVYRF